MVNGPEACRRLTGALLGQALGDAVGFVVEGLPTDTAAAYVRDCLERGRAGERAHPKYPFGQYTDDTQLARELLLSVRDSGRWRPENFARRVADLFRRGLDVGAGPGTRAAAGRLARGMDWHESGTPPPYAGNGSAMRAAPLGLVFQGAPDTLRAAARQQSLVTHLDPRCAGGAVAIAGAAALAVAPGRLDRPAFIHALEHWVREEDASVADALARLEEWADLPPEAAARRLHDLELDPSGGGYHFGLSPFVTSTVVWALYAFLHSPDDYWTTICTAIRIGGDTDTLAAMAGAISGARLGVDALPRSLVHRLTDQGTWGAAQLAALAADCVPLCR
ncbi:MAG TPA: ADP-ribosylglycohydrolase family protein [Gemmatimonadales bacterium]